MNFLDTLDQRNVTNGLAEMIKMALIFDKEYFFELEKINMIDLINNK